MASFDRLPNPEAGLRILSSRVTQGAILWLRCSIALALVNDGKKNGDDVR